MTHACIPKKRAKLDLNDMPTNSSLATQIEISKNETKWTINVVLSDEYTNPIEQTLAFAGSVRETKSISPIMAALSKNLPLNRLNHLKRINKMKVLLCAVNDIEQFLRENETNAEIMKILNNETIKLQNVNDHRIKSILRLYLNKNGITSEIVDLLCVNEALEIVSVASRAPVLNRQYRDVSRLWPCKFYPNKEIEKMMAGEWFTSSENDFNVEIMKICKFMCKEVKRKCCGIAVDPRTNTIVAIGFDELDKHPLMHCPMVLIDAIARTQMGGAWNDILIENEVGSLYTNDDSAADKLTFVGVSPFLRNLIESNFPTVRFGAERVQSICSETERNLVDSVNSDNLEKYGPYLATGYDVYLTQEPCIMCAMALTHSRVRRIFFAESQPAGAIKSIVKFSSIKALNHHFLAFHITETDRTDE